MLLNIISFRQLVQKNNFREPLFKVLQASQFFGLPLMMINTECPIQLIQMDNRSFFSEGPKF